jgi:hypothetical protein
MSLLHAGVDVTVIALWLGHSSPASTRVYLHADMAIKERALRAGGVLPLLGQVRSGHDSVRPRGRTWSPELGHVSAQVRVGEVCMFCHHLDSPPTRGDLKFFGTISVPM